MEFVEIRTLSKRPKKIRVPQALYKAVTDLIYTSLATETEISLQRLIEIGEATIDTDDRTDLPWLIVQIKNDLLYRQLVLITIDRERNQLIRFKKRRASLALGHLAL